MCEESEGKTRRDACDARIFALYICILCCLNIRKVSVSLNLRKVKERHGGMRVMHASSHCTIECKLFEYTESECMFESKESEGTTRRDACDARMVALCG